MHNHIDSYSLENKRRIFKIPQLGDMCCIGQVCCDITSDGKVWNPYTHKWISPTIDHARTYRKYCISHNSNRFTFLLHRELAKWKIPNPLHKIHVVFKDVDKSNLSISNLAWSFFKSHVIGLHNNSLTIVEELSPTKVKCLCDCSNDVITYLSHFKNGHKKSCGCKTYVYKKHGMSYHPLYNTYLGMRTRCCNEKHHLYHRYGGRGISICDEWSREPDGIINFIDWSETNGWYEGCGLELDRIDNDGNYEPSNCRYTTAIENANNRSSTIKLEHNGSLVTLRELANSSEFRHRLIYERICRGLSIEEALTKTRGYAK